MKNFIMNWRGNLISITANPLGVTENSHGVVMSWRIFRMDIPSMLQDQRDVVVALVKEAFATMGDIYDGEQYAAVNVNFDPTTRT